MTVRFGNYRVAFYVAVFLLSGVEMKIKATYFFLLIMDNYDLLATVLGLSAHFAAIFLPKLHHDFTIFSIIVPSLSIFVFLITLQWSQPRSEAVVLFVLGTLWLAMGAWSADIIGHIQCDGLVGQRTATKNGDMPATEFCYEMKIIEAFSWMLFVLFAIALYMVLRLVTEAERFGRYDIWWAPIQELPWFGEAPGYYNTHPGGMVQYPVGGYAYPMQNVNAPVVQTPGHSIIIQPGMNGQPPTVTQVPLGTA